MAIRSSSTIVDRTKKVLALCEAAPIPSIPSKTFDRNLRRCFWRSIEALGYCVLYGQTVRGKRLPDILNALLEANPAGWDDDELSDYEFGIRKYLWAVVFGMTPGTPWHGPDSVDGYLIATKNEEVLAYQVSRQSDFENYLLKHASVDTPDASRYELMGEVRQEGGRWYYYLQCAIKFQPSAWIGEAKFSLC